MKRLACPAVLLLLLLPAITLAEGPYVPDREWEAIPPVEAGMDPRLLEEALAFAGERNSHGLVVVRGGRIVAERYWNGWSRQTVRDMYSAQKSVDSVLVGIAHERGFIPDLDESASTWFHEWKGTEKEKITVRHLLTMTSGLHSSVRSDMIEHMRAKDKTGFALDLPLDYDPGTRWAYCNPAYGLVGTLIHRATKKTRDEFAQEVLFRRIGMLQSRCAMMSVTENSERLTHHGLETTCRDMARFGLLILRGGRWGKEQIVSSRYVDMATRPSGSDNGAYGYLWWLNGSASHRTPYLDRTRKGMLFPDAPTDTVAALGAKDSKIYVIRSLDLVITRLGESGSPGRAAAMSDFDNPLLQKICAAVKR